ncbi:MAG: ribose-phosphate pyrophosphokinase [Myxococcota bacterium]
MPHEQSLKVFAGTSNEPLANAICDYLDVPLGDMNIVRFSDGEIFVECGDNVRGVEVFVVQSTCSPSNENLMELLIMIDALKRASADSICAVIPYYGYARQDRKVQPRTPITSKLVADLLTAAGASRVLSIDLHAGQIQGFFDIPFDHMYAMPVLLDDMVEKFDPSETVVVSPDAGGVERARAYAKRLGSTLAIIDKRRPSPNVAKVMNIIGDVEGKHAVLVDDIIDTAGTMTEASSALVERGAKSVCAYATHPVLSGPAIERIKVLSCAPLLAKAMRRIHFGESVSSLFV